MPKARTITLLGDHGVGKSCLSSVFGSGKIPEKNDKGPAVYRTKLVVDLSPTVIRVIDLPAEHPEVDEVIKDAVGFILVYSITDKKSFESMSEYRDRIVRVLHGDEKVSILLVATNADKENDRKVDGSEGRELAEKWNCQFRELSCLDETSVDAAFLSFVRIMKQSISTTEIKHEVIVVASALLQVRQAYNVFKKRKEMSIKDCRTICAEISNPFPEDRFIQLLKRILKVTTGSGNLLTEEEGLDESIEPQETRLAVSKQAPSSNISFRSGSNPYPKSPAAKYASQPRPRMPSHGKLSSAGSDREASVTIAIQLYKSTQPIGFPAFLKLFFLWVEGGHMTQSARIYRCSSGPEDNGRSSSMGSAVGFGSNSVIDKIKDSAQIDSYYAVLEKPLIEEAFKYIRKLFNIFDYNHDGQIDLSELKAALATLTGTEPNESEVQSVLQELDIHGKGFLGFDEFLFVFYLLSVEEEDNDWGMEEMTEKSSELKIATRSGFLFKRNGIFRMWKKFYCLLEGTNLYVYKNAKSKVPKEEISLNGDCYIDGDIDRGTLDVNSGGQITQFRTQIPTEITGWLEDIRANLVSH